MDQAKFDSIREDLKKSLSSKRYDHTIGVTYTAASLAMKYNCDIDKAMLAGLLHDASKAYKSEEYVKMAAKYGIEVTEYEKKNPGLIHAKLSAYFAKTRYDIDDQEILDAIICHTTGKPNMNLLEKIIYISDYIEPSRKDLPRLDLVREMAFCNLDETLCCILEDCLDHLKEKGYVIDPMTEKTYLFYKKGE